MAKKVVVELTPAMNKVLAQHRIFVDTYGRFRAQKIKFIDNIEIEPYTGFLVGGSMARMGAFSTSRSVLEPGMSIGRYCAVGPGLTVMGVTHPYKWLTSNRFVYERETGPTRSYLEDHPGALPPRSIASLQKPDPWPRLGHDVWLASNVTLAQGVTVHTGAVVAANSVVVKDVPPYAIVGGNPATIIKRRFPDSVCDALLDSGWWAFEPSQLFDMDIENIEAFLESFSDRRSAMEPYEPVPFRPRRLLDMVEA